MPKQNDFKAKNLKIKWKEPLGTKVHLLTVSANRDQYYITDFTWPADSTFFVETSSFRQTMDTRLRYFNDKWLFLKIFQDKNFLQCFIMEFCDLNFSVSCGNRTQNILKKLLVFPSGLFLEHLYSEMRWLSWLLTSYERIAFHFGCIINKDIFPKWKSIIFICQVQYVYIGGVLTRPLLETHLRKCLSILLHIK